MRWTASTTRSVVGGFGRCGAGASDISRGTDSTGGSTAFLFPVRVSFTRGRLWLDDADNPREEPSAGKPHARICGGEAEWPSYPTIPPSPSSSNATTSAGASKSSRIARHSKRASNTSYAMPLSANVCPRNRVRYMSRRRKPNSRRPNQRQGTRINQTRRSHSSDVESSGRSDAMSERTKLIPRSCVFVAPEEIVTTVEVEHPATLGRRAGGRASPDATIVKGCPSRYALETCDTLQMGTLSYYRKQGDSLIWDLLEGMCCNFPKAA